MALVPSDVVPGGDATKFFDEWCKGRKCFRNLSSHWAPLTRACIGALLVVRGTSMPKTLDLIGEAASSLASDRGAMKGFVEAGKDETRPAHQCEVLLQSIFDVLQRNDYSIFRMKHLKSDTTLAKRSYEELRKLLQLSEVSPKVCDAVLCLAFLILLGDRRLPEVLASKEPRCLQRLNRALQGQMSSLRSEEFAVFGKAAALIVSAYFDDREEGGKEEEEDVRADAVQRPRPCDDGAEARSQQERAPVLVPAAGKRAFLPRRGPRDQPPPRDNKHRGERQAAPRSPSRRRRSPLILRKRRSSPSAASPNSRRRKVRRDEPTAVSLMMRLRDSLDKLSSSTNTQLSNMLLAMERNKLELHDAMQREYARNAEAVDKKDAHLAEVLARVNEQLRTAKHAAERLQLAAAGLQRHDVDAASLTVLKDLAAKIDAGASKFLTLPDGQELEELKGLWSSVFDGQPLPLRPGMTVAEVSVTFMRLIPELREAVEQLLKEKEEAATVHEAYLFFRGHKLSDKLAAALVSEPVELPACEDISRLPEANLRELLAADKSSSQIRGVLLLLLCQGLRDIHKALGGGEAAVDLLRGKVAAQVDQLLPSVEARFSALPDEYRATVIEQCRRYGQEVMEAAMTEARASIEVQHNAAQAAAVKHQFVEMVQRINVACMEMGVRDCAKSVHRLVPPVPEQGGSSSSGSDEDGSSSSGSSSSSDDEAEEKKEAPDAVAGAKAAARAPEQ
jgi:hypothetical protein